MSSKFAPTLLLLALLAGPVLADDVRERVAFAPGSSELSLEGTIQGYDGRLYVFPAGAGQTLSVTMKASNGASYFNVWAPGKEPGRDAALFASDVGGETYRSTLAESGDYMVQVYLYRSAARRNESSKFTVDVTLEGGQAGTAPSDDFADGLSGGPDFWEVSGLAAGKTVNLRRGPSTAAAVVARFPNGTILRNKGCRIADGRRWCSVERRDAPDVVGWIAGRFLREASAGEGAPSGDALVPGTNFHAVGRIPCKIAGQPAVADCEFGVTRGAAGAATVFIKRPGAADLVIAFDNGKVSPQQSVADFAYSRDQDNTRVTIDGGRETYTIPDAVIFGG